MDRLEAYRRWWQPLPAWLKFVTAAGIYPAWFFIVYCVLIGESKGLGAAVAFGVFVTGTLLHVAFDRRNRGGSREHGGFDVVGDE